MVYVSLGYRLLLHGYMCEVVTHCDLSERTARLLHPNKSLQTTIVRTIQTLLIQSTTAEPQLPRADNYARHIAIAIAAIAGRSTVYETA